MVLQDDFMAITSYSFTSTDYIYLNGSESKSSPNEVNGMGPL